MAFLDFIPLVGSAVNAISSLFGGSQQNKNNLQAVRETNQANMDIAKYQAEQNMQLWQANNEYNSPAAQMARYKEAGLNPNLIYGSGSASAGNSSSPAKGFDSPSMEVPRFDYSYVRDASNTMMEGLAQAMSIKKTQAEIDSIRQNTLNLGSDNELKKLNMAYFSMRNAKSKVESDYWRQQFEAELAKTDSQAVLNWSNAQNVDTNRLLTEALKPYEIQYRQAQLANALETNTSLRFANHLNPLKKQELLARIAQLSVTSYGKELENKISEVLISTGINLRGSALERAVAELLSVLGENFGSDDSWFGKFLNRFVKP